MSVDVAKTTVALLEILFLRIHSTFFLSCYFEYRDNSTQGTGQEQVENVSHPSPVFSVV